MRRCGIYFSGDHLYETARGGGGGTSVLKLHTADLPEVWRFCVD